MTKTRGNPIAPDGVIPSTHGPKDIIVKWIDGDSARAFVKRNHYSGKVVSNSQIHLGCFLNGVLGGVMQFGPPMDKSKLLPIFDPVPPWGAIIELNRMAFSDILPKNSESRCIAVAIRMIKRQYPHMKAIISFADGTQCGDGTIYRAAGFLLSNIGRNQTMFQCSATGARTTALQMTTSRYNGILYRTISDFQKANPTYKRIPGFMLRYVKILCPDTKLKLDPLPYSAIIDAGASMYKGIRRA